MTSLKRINLSDFLVTTDSLPQQQHIRVQNDTFHRRSEPYPSYEFADFRKNDFYIKVPDIFDLKIDFKLIHFSFT